MIPNAPLPLSDGRRGYSVEGAVSEVLSSRHSHPYDGELERLREDIGTMRELLAATLSALPPATVAEILNRVDFRTWSTTP